MPEARCYVPRAEERGCLLFVAVSVHLRLLSDEHYADLRQDARTILLGYLVAMALSLFPLIPQSRAPELAVLRSSARERRLRGRQARDRYAIRRRRDVGQPDLVAELDRRWIAAVLAADADLEILAGLAPAVDRDLHHRTDPLAVEDLERIRRDDLLLDVPREEALLRVVARDP